MNDFPPADFRQRITASFARQGAMRLIAAELTRIEHGTVEIELPFSDDLTQQHGFLHAGVISAALDSACSYAAYTVLDPDASLLTIEFKVNLMSPGRGERFLFRGEVTKPGSTIIVADAREPQRQVDADMVEMETFAILRACQAFAVPLIGLRGISDGKAELRHVGDWTEYLHVIDEKLAAAVDRLEQAVKSGALPL